MVQPLEAELNETSEQVRKASKEVAELQEAALLVEEERTEREKALIEPARAVPSAVSTDMLINFNSPTPPPSDQFNGKSHDQSCDQSCDSLINPSLDSLRGDSELLMPEKLDNTPLMNSHKPEPSSQCLSQELF